MTVIGGSGIRFVDLGVMTYVSQSDIKGVDHIVITVISHFRSLGLSVMTDIDHYSQ